MILFSVVGCSPKADPKTVEYYLANANERNNLLALCANNPGKYKDDGDCINADRAKTKAQADYKFPPIKFK